MLEDLLMTVSGVVILTLTLFLFWLSMPRPNGPPRWFIGTNLEAMVSVSLTGGLVLGIGMLAAGILAVLGIR